LWLFPYKLCMDLYISSISLLDCLLSKEQNMQLHNCWCTDWKSMKISMMCSLYVFICRCCILLSTAGINPGLSNYWLLRQFCSDSFPWGYNCFDKGRNHFYNQRRWLHHLHNVHSCSDRSNMYSHCWSDW